MLINPQIFQKIGNIESRYQALRFETALKLDAEYFDTDKHLRAPPENVEWISAVPGERWGGDWLTRWFRAEFKTPASLEGKKIFLRARTGAPETLAAANSEFIGVFDRPPQTGGRPNHYAICLAPKAESGKIYHVFLEAYSGHSFPGNHPDEIVRAVTADSNLYEGVEILAEREEVSSFVFDLAAARLSMEALGEDNLRKYEIARVLEKLFACVCAMPSELEERVWLPSMRVAHALLTPLLAAGKGSAPLPRMGLIGHSHLDTAWIWTVDETKRKCARTFSSVLNLMDQYDEFLFIQSSPCHADMLRREYPSIFSRMKARVREGRWEPNGAMWVEPDCNIPSGESLIRQILIGQRTTREMFGCTADTLWLPDTFGFSGALPQILAKAGVKYFCTTKMAWGEVKFPFDSFLWEGIDGTSVLAHFHKINFAPDPKTLAGFWRDVQHKDVQDSLLCPFGLGDGGGGPDADMIETARRVKRVEGLFSAGYTTVSRFMGKLAESKERMPHWSGELYLTAHRGTLTSIAKTKRLNRKAELALRDAEYLSARASLAGMDYPGKKLDTLWKTLLLNQFHDILPGSAIAEVNDRAQHELVSLIDQAEKLSRSAMESLPDAGDAICLSLFNTLSWERKSVFASIPKGMHVEGADVQFFPGLDNEEKILIGNISVAPFASLSLKLSKGVGQSREGSPFTVYDGGVDSPHIRLEFDSGGRITHCVDKRSGRELVRDGGAFNRFLIAEDIPAAWDNWDINEDHFLRETEDARLTKREIISNGALALCLRSEWRIGSRSSVLQDMMIHAGSPRVDFMSKIIWRERHTLLKTAFDIDLLSDSARYEIQYGHVERPRRTSLKEERAMFETAVHKWMDVSETGFGVALLNDCKYGAHAGKERMTLTLIKGGTHPDPRGDEGVHYVSYSIFPHAAFSSDVIREAGEFNSQTPFLFGKPKVCGPLLRVDKPNVIVECVKWAETGKAFVLRVYETECTGARVRIVFEIPVKSLFETDLLEERAVELPLEDGELSFLIRPFEIRTFRCNV